MSDGENAARDEGSGALAVDRPAAVAVRVGRQTEDAKAARREARRRLQAVQPAAYAETAPEPIRERPPAPRLPPRAIEMAEFAELPPFPRQSRRRAWRVWLSFFLMVVAPTAAAAYYYYEYATPQYVTEFRFAVSDSTAQTASQTAMSGLSSLLGGPSASNYTQNYMVVDYLTSRQAVDELSAKLDLRTIYGHPDAYWWERFDTTQPNEAFYRYWPRMVTASYDQVTGLAIAQVRAFTAEDAFAIGTALVAQSEELINKIARRPLLESVTFADGEVKRAEERLKATRAALTAYRNAESVIDPVSGAVVGNTTLLQELRTGLQQTQTELSVLRRQKVGTESPLIRQLERRESSLKDQISELERKIASNKQGTRALSAVVGDYEQLDLERQFAQTMVTSAMTTLEQARANAIAQRIFVTPYVRPTLPQSSTYPNKPVAVSTTALIAMLVWMCGLMVVRSVGERLA